MTSCFDWNKYLEYAKNYNEEGLEEFQYRSAASRAYYFVFHEAKEYLKKEQINESKEGKGSHEKLWNTFIQNTQNDLILKAVGNDGTNLRKKRTTADYYNSKKISLRDVKEAIRIADKTERILNQKITEK